MGTCRAFMLWMSLLQTVFRNALLMSRNSAAVTFLPLQVFLTVVVTMCIVSVVLCPGLPPNCKDGRRLCFSARNERSLATRVDSNLPIVKSDGSVSLCYIICWFAGFAEDKGC